VPVQRKAGCHRKGPAGDVPRHAGPAGPCEPRCPGSPVFAPGLTHRSLRLGLRQNRKPLPCSHRSRGCPRHGAAIRPDGNASGNHQVADNATRTADLRESDKMMLTSYRKSKSRIQGPPARALQSQQELLARILTRGYREAAQVQSWPANVPRRLPRIRRSRRPASCPLSGSPERASMTVGGVPAGNPSGNHSAD
jgi:hypothetical protein